MTEFHKRSNKTRHNQLKRHLAHVERRRRPEDHKRLKEAGRRRRAERARQGPRQREWIDGEGDAETFEKFERRDAETRKDDPTPDAAKSEERSEPASDIGHEATVVSLARGRATLTDPTGTWVADLSVELQRTQQTALAVGDRVRCSRHGDHARLVEVLPRRTTLSRPDPGNPHRRRVLAANVDVAVLVVSVRKPRFRPGLVDRFLVALEHGGVRPVVVANKVDLLDDPDDRAAIREALAPYPTLGVPTVTASAETGEGLRELSEHLTGRTSVFVGHSGVGKSSLLNGLDPQGRRLTREGRGGDGKGRHTTTASVLTELPDGTVVIDTPGIRAFGLWHMDRASLAASFPEFSEHAAACRFRDCTHLVEPGCAVHAAVASGAIPAARFASYERIHASLGEDV